MSHLNEAPGLYFQLGTNMEPIPFKSLAGRLPPAVVFIAEDGSRYKVTLKSDGRLEVRSPHDCLAMQSEGPNSVMLATQGFGVRAPFLAPGKGHTWDRPAVRILIAARGKKKVDVTAFTYEQARVLAEEKWQEIHPDLPFPQTFQTLHTNVRVRPGNDPSDGGGAQ